MPYEHVPVLLEPALSALDVKPDGIYVDGTFGRGGHSRAILDRLGTHGRLYALDCDPQAVACARELESVERRFTLTRARFSTLGERCTEWGIAGKVDGVLLDIGVSSPQLDDPARGFSFEHDGPLDMRMDFENGMSAAELVNSSPRNILKQIFRDYGEENFAGKVASAIVRERERKPFTRTGELAALIERTIPGRNVGKHKATRCFQALRIAVNGELEELQMALKSAVEVLAPDGVLAVISFHSLEDRLVKRFMQEQSAGERVPAALPLTFEQTESLRLNSATLGAVAAPVKADEAELTANPRARSATLRSARRLARSLTS
ncbi:MAG: 16S rRNA (cytosine(1402)-N(4))-methyltransferase RsmH [Succinivibrio sp.]|nr:16S rRNA (cytosine(1402)-N(4))-methyltransferase RsmH [Succinivibrio sp.]